MTERDPVLTNLHAYKQKYYKALMLRGALLTLLVVICLLVVGGVLEYSFWFDSTVRTILALLFISLSSIIVYKTIVIPILFLAGKNIGMSDEKAAMNIGKYYTDIDDKLLNYLQINSFKGSNSLVIASINQRTENISNVSYDHAINIKDYIKTAPYLLAVSILVTIVSFWQPSILIDSTRRIVNFNQIYSPPALFKFVLEPNQLTGYKNESITVEVSTLGQFIPESAYIVMSNRKVKMNSLTNGVFSHQFVSTQESFTFQVESTGIRSESFNLNILLRPSLKSFATNITYPSYTKKSQESLVGVGNLSVPKGSEITWNINTSNTDSVAINFGVKNKIIPVQLFDNQHFKSNYTADTSGIYHLSFFNQTGTNKEPLSYFLEVIEDQHPKITVEHYQDTTLFNYVLLNGKISDDYGLSRLRLHYKTSSSSSFKSSPIKISRVKEQTFYHKWLVSDLIVNGEEELTYYLEVWDNDAVSGPKSTRSSAHKFSLPKESEINNLISKSEQKAEKDIDDALDQANELGEELKQAKEELKGKKELTWQDENKLKKIIEKKKAINEAIQELKEQNKKSNLQKERFNKQQERIKEKAEQLQKLMDDLLDEETKKLYEELQKLLEDNKDVSEIQENLSKLDNKEKNLEKELERALELFKRIQLEQKVDNSINELEQLSKDQESLKESTLDKSLNNEEVSSQQEEINKKTNEAEKAMDEINELNQELKSPESIPDQSEKLDDIKETQSEIKKDLEKGKRKKGAEKQQKASDKMQELANEMKKMQSGMQMEMMQENLDHLRDIVHSLIKLSFDEESLMGEFRTIDQSDPRFVDLSQTQIKLKDDAEILEDSLLSLASRVFQISSFVTREVSDMNQYMDESSLAIKERHKQQAVSKQQFAMTSMNNLALLLDDVLQQMQQQMADAMGKPKPGDKDGKDKPGMSELQKSLNEKIKSLKKGNQQGRKLSEELAELAAEQEQLRKSLEKLQNIPGSNPSDKKAISDLIKKMEETEVDLVNKNITSQTIKRQEEILTRLLQSEDALREQEKDLDRESKTAQDYEDFVPKVFEQYLKEKEKELELLKSTPPHLYPHFKNEVNQYFERVNETTDN
jgi:hypothetical protein